MRKIIISIIMFCVGVLMYSNVFATTGTITANASSNSIIKGKNFTVTISATSDLPIEGADIKFDYDKNVLELVKKSAGENYGDNTSENEILVINNSNLDAAKSVNLYTLTFKVLENANVGNSVISFNSAELHLKEESTLKEVSVDNVNSITISIKEDETLPTNDSSKSNEENTPKTTTETQKTETTKKDTTKADTKKTLPQTGIGVNGIIAFIVIAIVGIFSYVAYKKI